MNQAVNNLLSREDDDGDDEGEAGIIRLGFPPGGVYVTVIGEKPIASLSLSAHISTLRGADESS